MSALTVPQVVASLRAVLPQVTGQTSPNTVISDGQALKKTYVDWIEVAKSVSQTASMMELPKLDQYQLALQYRTESLKSEPPAELDPLKTLFSKLMARLSPGGMSDEFMENQLRHLSKRYPAYAQKLLKSSHESLAIEFFRFCLQAPSQSSHKDVSHWVDLFVKYPEFAERLMRSSLYEKLGRFPENIHVHNEKGVCIQMNILEQGVVFVHVTSDGLCHFKNEALGGNTEGITLTGEQIFQQFENYATPDIDVSSTGIINFNSFLMQSRDSKGKIHLVDPINWTNYMPFVELSFNELQKRFPEAQTQTPFMLVLRVHSSAESASETFFDFIMKTSNGKYRVFSLQEHRKLGNNPHRQKSFFYPLTSGQGKMVIEKVAKEIGYFRQMHAERKPIPPFDVQSYIDGVLGHDFYAYLDQFISENTFLRLTKEEMKAQLTQVRQRLDPEAFEQFLQPVVEKLVNTHDMSKIHTFIATSLLTIHTVLGTDRSKIKLPTVEEVTNAGRDLNTLDPMKPSLIALALLCFEVLHPYKMSVTDAEKETPVLGLIFSKIESIPWPWLQNLLYSFFLMILGPSRNYHYKTVDTSSLKTLPRLVQSIRNLVPEKYINRPSQLFDSLSETQRETVERRLKQHLTPLVAAVI
ncbi:MAG TPA: hypothetical protein VHK67_07395 [Rhabdochlamydiaceae bacterium]|jgi:hypothetical protein|nr:hypothetical protein [Rhabdochlamydiaceae bacterium]